MRSAEFGNRNPIRVSAVVPTFRRPDHLQRCLTGLDAQSLDPSEYEVIVADDAADLKTKKEVEEFAGTARATVRYIAVHGEHGPAAARNAGWRAARAATVAFTDDDTIPHRHWLAAGLAAWDRAPEAVAVTGRIIVPRSAPPTDYERNEAGLESAEFVTANCFVRRAALEMIGGFDTRFRAAWREDSDLQFALLRLGGKIVHAPDACVVHPVRPAPWGVSVFQQRKVLYDALLYKKHPEYYRRHIRSHPPLNYYAIVAAATLAVLCSAHRNWACAAVAASIWGVLTAEFASRRLAGASRRPSHIAEMVVTSVAIPFLSVFWRLRGAARFRVLFW